MQGTHIFFSKIPQIGFAHHYSREGYSQYYAIDDNSFEVVYIKSGTVVATLYEKNYEVTPGSIMVLFRQLPVTLTSAKNTLHTHCTVQIKTDTEAEFVDSNTAGFDRASGGVYLPFIIPPCTENEIIKKELYSIVSLLGTHGEEGMFSASLMAMGILSKLDAIYRQKLFGKNNRASLMEYKIKKYIAANINREISLSDISKDIGKSPNYINSVFKETAGMCIRQYINREKVRIICELILKCNLSFKEACESVAVYDVSYGYRLFKKHTGVTPAEFTRGKYLQ